MLTTSKPSNNPTALTTNMGTNEVYQNCYASTDSTGARLIAASNPALTHQTALTQQTCLTFCQGQQTDANTPWTYIGIENGSDCRCGMTYNIALTLATGCNTAMTGDSTQAGGGSGKMIIWKYVAVRQLSMTSSVLKSSVLCKLFLQSLQGEYQVGTTALRPSHLSMIGGLWPNNDILPHHEQVLTSNRCQQHEMRRRERHTVSTS
jgi:hypothetical protein